MRHIVRVGAWVNIFSLLYSVWHNRDKHNSRSMTHPGTNKETEAGVTNQTNKMTRTWESEIENHEVMTHTRERANDVLAGRTKYPTKYTRNKWLVPILRAFGIKITVWKFSPERHEWQIYWSKNQEKRNDKLSKKWDDECQTISLWLLNNLLNFLSIYIGQLLELV